MNHDETNLPEKKPEMQTWIEPELEARIVAWVAGEASAFEVAELERLVAEKPELAIFKQRIEAVHGLVGEAARKDRTPLRMAEERRAKLLETLRDKAEPAPLSERIATLPKIPSPWSWRAPRIYFTLSGVAAACLAVFVTVQISKKPVYEASATLQFQKPDNAVVGGRVYDPTVQNEYDINTYIQVLNSAKLKQKVSESLARDLEAAKARMEVARAKGTKVSEQDQALVRLAVSSIQNAPAPSQPIAVTMAAPAAPSLALAAPPEITAGPKPDSPILNLTAPDKATLTWAAIGNAAQPPNSGEKINFFQPSSSPSVLNVVSGGLFSTGGAIDATSVSTLSGTISANGNVYVLNPKGVAVDQLAQINTGGFFATSVNSSGGKVSPAGATDGNRALTFNESAAAVPANQFSFNNSIQAGGGGAVTLGGTLADNKKAAPAAPAPVGGIAGAVTVSRASPDRATAKSEEILTLAPVVVAEDRGNAGYAATSSMSTTRARGVDTDVGYLAGGTTGTTATATNKPADNEVVTLSAFSVASTKSARRPVTNPTSKAPSPPTPSVARARTAPSRPTPADTMPVAALAPTPAAPLSPTPTPFAPAALGVISLDARKDAVNDELKRANLEAAKKQFEERAKAEAEKAKAKQLEDAPLAKPAPLPTPPIEESSAAKEPTSTFSLHVSDVSFRLAAAALARGELPDAARIRPEEFYNALDYGDPAPSPAEKVSARIEQSVHPFAQQRNLVRIAMKVGATGRGAGTPLHLTVLLDTSGSMEREDRRATVQRAMAVLVSLLGANDRLTLIGFARTPRLLAENIAGNAAGGLVDLLARTPSEGGTNLEEALKLAGELARRHRNPAAQNRIVMLTDGAANLGNAVPAQLATAIATLRTDGIAFDACGVGLDGLDDDILESLTRSGDGRYYALNSPADADAGFAQKLAGAFRPAAENVKLQVRFNPARVGAYRLIGFEQHRLRAEDFRNDKVDAAELAAEEAAVALYQIEALPAGEGDLGEVFVRFRDPATGTMVERSWPMTYDARAAAFDRASPTMQLAGTAAALAEKLHGGAPASLVRLADLAPVVNSLRTRYPNAPRVQELATMYAQLRRVTRE